MEATTGASALNVGEYWVDMAWEGSELKANQVSAAALPSRWDTVGGRKPLAARYPQCVVAAGALPCVRVSDLLEFWQLLFCQTTPPACRTLHGRRCATGSIPMRKGRQRTLAPCHSLQSLCMAHGCRSTP